MIKNIYLSLPRYRKKQFTILLMLLLISSFFELLSMVAILPFISLISGNGISDKYILISKFHFYTQIDNKLLLFTSFLVLVTLLNCFFKIAVTKLGFAFSFGAGMDIGINIFSKVLHQPYSYHVANNSSELLAGFNKVQSILYNVLNPLILLITSFFLALGVIVGLISITSFTTFITLFFVGMIYFIFSIFIKGKIRKNSSIIASEEISKIKIIQESLGGIRDILIDSSHEILIDNYKKIEINQRAAQSSSAYIGILPKFFLEALSISLMALFATFLFDQNKNSAYIVTAFGAIAFGAQKLIPYMQQIFSCWTSIHGNFDNISDVNNLINLNDEKHSSNINNHHILFKDSIEIVNLKFNHVNSHKTIVDGINLTIHSGDRVGFIGKSGSGKSTFLDLFMGLLIPVSGSITVDGLKITTSNKHLWQKYIGHVSQSVFLIDASIAENIAFGVPFSQINFNKIHECINIVQLSDFIRELPLGLNTSVGERGIQISGGQKQRIGLARALYKSPKILVLDEATSALDEATEKKVISAINSYDNSLTIIMVAHRISTLVDCSKIYEFHNGNIIRRGTFFELFPSFNMAN